MSNEYKKEILKHLDKISYRSNRYQIFDDWLTLMLCCLMQDDDTYFKTIERYKNDELDLFAKAFGSLMIGMSKHNDEILGELYMEWNISNKHTGQFFTPMPIAELCANITGSGSGKVLDCACGAGAMLVAKAKGMTYEDCNKSLFVGQDIDMTCVNMCALNMCFFNLNGYAVHGNSLKVEANYGYKTTRTIYGGEIRLMTKDELEMIAPSIQEGKKQAALF